jgi:hypothetical protein
MPVEHPFDFKKVKFVNTTNKRNSLDPSTRLSTIIYHLEDGARWCHDLNSYEGRWYEV